MRDNADVKKAKKGDIDSLNRLFEQYYDVIYSYCYRHVRHKEAAQDITQEVFLRVCRHFSDYRHYGKFENYLYVIAGNLCKDYFKKPVEYSLEDAELPLNTSDFNCIENRICIQQAMDRLPELEREIIYLRFDEDLKIKDIAKILGLQLSTTKYHLRKAQSLLQQEIRKGGMTNGVYNHILQLLPYSSLSSFGLQSMVSYPFGKVVIPYGTMRWLTYLCLTVVVLPFAGRAFKHHEVR